MDQAATSEKNEVLVDFSYAADILERNRQAYFQRHPEEQDTA